MPEKTCQKNPNSRDKYKILIRHGHGGLYSAPIYIGTPVA